MVEQRGQVGGVTECVGELGGDLGQRLGEGRESGVELGQSGGALGVLLDGRERVGLGALQGRRELVEAGGACPCRGRGLADVVQRLGQELGVVGAGGLLDDRRLGAEVAGVLGPGQPHHLGVGDPAAERLLVVGVGRAGGS